MTNVEPYREFIEDYIEKEVEMILKLQLLMNEQLENQEIEVESS